MTTYGPPGQPDDPYQRPPGSPEGPPPVDPTLPQWGQPPATGAEPPTAPQWGQPPATGAGYPPPSPTSGAGYPPTSGAGYPPPAGGQPVPGGQGGYPPAGPFPPAGPTPAPAAGAQWGTPPLGPGGYGAPPVAPPQKKNGGKIALIIGLVALLLLCTCLGLVGLAVWQFDDKASTTSAPTASAESTQEPSAAPTTAEPSPTQDDDFAIGDCVVNDGTDDDAELRKVPCGPNTYEVLLRIPGTIDGDRCQTRAPESTANYVHDNPRNSRDYVLCLKER